MAASHPVPHITLHGWIKLLVFLAMCCQATLSCTDDYECGWNSHCVSSHCQCIPGYTLTSNARDCTDSRCSDPRCLDCPGNGDSCRRCVNFIEASTGQCLDACRGSYVLVVEGAQVGRVCPVHKEEQLMTIYIAIIIGIGVGIIVTGLLGIAFYWKLRNGRYRKDRVKNLEQDMDKQKQLRLDKEEIQEDVAYDNEAYAGCVTEACDAEDKPIQLSYLQQVAALRPYTDTFRIMLDEARQKQQSLPLDDNRQYVYRNVIQQLCRVGSILTQTSGHLIMPPDGEQLLAWAKRVLQTYLQVNQPSSNPSESESGTGTMTSTFKPDLKLIPNGNVHGDENSCSSSTYKYQRCGPATEQNALYEELSSVELMDEFTEPIEV